MAGITECCSVCKTEFDVQFRYQMEERDGGFSYYCSQQCLERSQRAGSDDAAKQADAAATCDACGTRFTPELAAHVIYLRGRRNYACGVSCRSQLVREDQGARLGDIASNQPTTPRAPTNPVVTPMQAPAAPVAPAIEARPRHLAIFNHKGGTGKTTTAVSIAAGLASEGYRVLLVDTDAQGNVSVSLGAKAERSLYHVLVMGLPVKHAAQTIRPDLDLLPSNETLAAAELYLAGRQQRDRILKDRLQSAAKDYDYVILDCSPSLSLMNQNALVFADSVLVPVACDYLSLVGVRQVIKTVKNVNSLLHHPVQIWGVLPTMFDKRAKICHEAVAALQNHFGDRCLDPIRATMKIKEAPSQGQTIFEYAAGSSAAEDYRQVVRSIINAREASNLVAHAAMQQAATAVGAAAVAHSA